MSVRMEWEKWRVWSKELLRQFKNF